MFTTTAFIFRIAFAWWMVFVAVMIFWGGIFGFRVGWISVIGLATVVLVGINAYAHVRRVRLLAEEVTGETLANRQRRAIEIPLEPGEAFDLLDAAVRELPGIEHVESARDSLQVRATVRRLDPYTSRKDPAKRTWYNALPDFLEDVKHNQVLATVAPGDGTGRVRLLCEPEGPAWADWFLVDHGTNLENAEAIVRAITRRIGERRKLEQASVRQTETEKELTVAKLSLLHAQVEPHFLYNTLASAQILTRSDPARADLMLGNLIAYLRHSLPRAEDAPSSLGEEVERARAYLEILRIRMGERLQFHVDVPAELDGVQMPPMMLQTLVENAIKHGLEPQTGGGSVWIRARDEAGQVAVTIADDGRGFSAESSGTGVGLKNIGERLRLAYGPAASFSITTNFPKGVAATIRVPRA